jgi:hypothetical protein
MFIVAVITPLTAIVVALAMFGRWLDWQRRPSTKPVRGQRLLSAWHEIRRFLVYFIWAYLGAAVVLAIVFAAAFHLFEPDALAFLATYTCLILLAARMLSVWPFGRR